MSSFISASVNCIGTSTASGLAKASSARRACLTTLAIRSRISGAGPTLAPSRSLVAKMPRARRAFAVGRDRRARLLDLGLPRDDLLLVLDERKADIPHPGGSSRAADALPGLLDARRERGASLRKRFGQCLELWSDGRPCADAIEVPDRPLRALREIESRLDCVLRTLLAASAEATPFAGFSLEAAPFAASESAPSGLGSPRFAKAQGDDQTKA